MILDKVNLLEDKPGCYLMYDKFDKVIYVGKAKSLKKRVSQYFLKEHSGKTKLMVSNVSYFDTIITNSEQEALLLENNLIKKYNPKYNILLKDDKRYPYIKLISYPYPYLEIARNIKDKKAKYFGPFADSSAAYNSINIINQLYKTRKCKNIGKKECLYSHLGMCLAPCINKVSKEDINEIINNIEEFYNGEAKNVKKILVNKMNEYSKNLDYENALECKKLIEYLDHILSKQDVELKNSFNTDFFAFSFKENYISMTTFIYRNGILIHKDNNIFESVSNEENLESLIIEYYNHHLIARNIVVPTYINQILLSNILKTKVNHVIKGSKKAILEMVATNAKKALQEYFLKENNMKNVLNELQDKLSLTRYPKTIELYDNSHLQGDSAIGVKVCYVDGISNKKLYRKYNINSDNKKDDLMSMREVLYRRLFKIISENDYKPDLIILDGGLNQINVCKELVSSFNLDIEIAGLVKDSKHNTKGLMDKDGNIIEIDKHSELFYLLVRMQDEVHRYAITNHRNKRIKSYIHSELDDIKGLGEKRRKILFNAYGSVDMIRLASVNELSQYVPIEIAKKVVEKLNNPK